MTNLSVADKIEALIEALLQLQTDLLAEPAEEDVYVPPEGFVENEEVDGWYDWALESPPHVLGGVSCALHVGFKHDGREPSVYIAGSNSGQRGGEMTGGYFTPDEIGQFIDALDDARMAVEDGLQP